MTYVKAFEDLEFERRGAAVRRRMEGSGFDLLVCQDPANMNWLTGFDGWSFYMPQAVLVHRDEASPIWFGRAQDARSASITTSLPAANIVAFSEAAGASPDETPVRRAVRADPPTRLGGCPDRRRPRRPLLHRQSAPAPGRRTPRRHRVRQPGTGELGAPREVGRGARLHARSRRALHAGDEPGAGEPRAGETAEGHHRGRVPRPGHRHRRHVRRLHQHLPADPGRGRPPARRTSPGPMRRCPRKGSSSRSSRRRDATTMRH